MKEELSINVRMNHNRSHLIGLSEHHIRKLEITNLSCSGYELA